MQFTIDVPSSLTKWISKARALLRRMFASLYLSQKTYSLISLIHTQCLDLRVSQRLEADWWVTWTMGQSVRVALLGLVTTGGGGGG